MDRQEIAEIEYEVSGANACAIRKHGCPFGGMEHSVSEAECAECGTDRLLALFTASQATDDALIKEQGILVEKQAKKIGQMNAETQAMREALTEAKQELTLMVAGAPAVGTTKQIIAKIDTVLGRK